MIKKMWSYSVVSVLLIGILQGCGGGGSDGAAGPDAPAPEVKADTAAPVVTSFTMPATASQTVSVSSFTATDDQAVTGYLVVCQSAAAPAASDARWTPAAPATVTATGVGQQSFYAWVKDAAGNVSASFAPVVVTVNPVVVTDTSAPVVTAFTMPATASQTVSVNSFTATDNQAVTGYLVVCQSAAAPAAGDARWTPAAPATVTATGVGQQSFYAWVRDAAGNVSAAFAPVVVTVNPLVNVSGSAFDTLAAKSDATFNFAPGNYQYNIPGFGAGDKLLFPAGNPPTVTNSSLNDGNVIVSYAKDQQIVTVVLTGLTTTQDQQIVGVSSFNSLFGAGSITQQ